MLIYNIIMLIQIFGERCSGTSFLELLLRRNVLDDKNKVTQAEKHNLPFENNTEEDVLYICIFRDLESWLQSIYKNPHHLIKIKGFDKFLLNQQKSTEKCINYKRKDCNKLCCNDHNKTIFQIRNNKIEKHLEFYHKQKNIIHLSLDFLQKNTMFFLHVLKQVYNINLVDTYEPNIPYTQPRKKEKLDKYKNRIYVNIKMKDYTNIINNYKNENYEIYVNSLKILCKKNGNAII